MLKPYFTIKSLDNWDMIRIRSCFWFTLAHEAMVKPFSTIASSCIKLRMDFLSLHREPKEYMKKHNDAVHWAAVNRELIAYRLLKLLGISTQAIKVSDTSHNGISIKEYGANPLYIHRKGASVCDSGAVIIPGSRGSLTYLVTPTDHTEISGYSLAHGAGRKWERSVCKAKLEANTQGKPSGGQSIREESFAITITFFLRKLLKHIKTLIP